MTVPTLEDSDLTDPREHLWWALVAMFKKQRAAMLWEPEIMKQFSQHLWECGIRYLPEEQRKRYVPPAGSDMRGRWLSNEDYEKLEREAISKLTPDQLLALLEPLRERMTSEQLAALSESWGA